MMAELIRNAWTGWVGFIADGKLVVPFFAALWFLWLYRGKEAGRSFLLYASVAAGCCVVPVTAALLMLYQTRFYDYEWVWSLVPLTALTSYGFAELLAECWKGFRGSLWRKGLPVVLLLMGVLALCGGLGKQAGSFSEEAEERREAEALLGRLEEAFGGGQICLWAPEYVLEYARELDQGIRVVYGRNMWDRSLNAYAYDTYDQSVIDLYRWMDQLDLEEWEKPYAEEISVTAAQCAETVRQKGVNCVLLPEAAEETKVAELEEALGTEAGRLEGYYLFVL